MKVYKSEFKNKTKVLMSVSGMGFGGTKQVFLNYINIIEKMGCDLTLLVRKNSATHKKLIEGFPHLINKIIFIKYFRIDLPFFRNIAISEYKKIYNKHKPDIIICHKSIDVYFSKISQIPSKIIGIAHGFISKKFMYYIKNADTIIAVSKTVSNYLKVYLPKSRIELLYNFIPISSNTKKKNNIIPLIGTMCVFRRKKNIPMLIKAAYLLKRRGIKFNLIIAGGGRQRINIFFHILLYGLTKEVKLKGWIKNKKEFFSGIDIFAVTSNTESFNVSIIESMSYGVPVISTKCGGPNEIIENENIGLLTNIGDALKFSYGLEKLLCDEKYRENLSNNARLHIVKNYSEEYAIKCLESIFINIDKFK